MRACSNHLALGVSPAYPIDPHREKPPGAADDPAYQPHEGHPLIVLATLLAAIAGVRRVRFDPSAGTLGDWWLVGGPRSTDCGLIHTYSSRVDWWGTGAGGRVDDLHGAARLGHHQVSHARTDGRMKFKTHAMLFSPGPVCVLTPNPDPIGTFPAG